MEAHETNREFKTGAVRDGGKKPALELISPHAMNRLGEWLRVACEDRVPPYPRRNWEKGMPFSATIASIQRHVEKLKLGSQAEDHVAAILFGGMALAHYQEEIKAGRMDPAIDDMPHYESQGLLPSRIQVITKNAEAGEVVVTQTLPSPGLLCAPSCPGCEAIYTNLKAAEPEPERAYGWRHYSEPAAAKTTSEIREFVRPFTVYLCGPITGQKVDYSWRSAATVYLAGFGIVTRDPLRGKMPGRISDKGLSYDGQLASVEMADRDRLDVNESNMILAHFPYLPPRQSIGSLMEMGMCARDHKTILLCTTIPEFNAHLFTRRFCILEPDFQKALDLIVRTSRARRI